MSRFLAKSGACIEELAPAARKFQDAAERRYAGIIASGKSVPWSEVRRYIERQRLPPRRPT